MHDTILFFPVPTTKNAFQRWLGMVGVFLRALQELRHHLTRKRLTSSKVSLRWTPTHQESFDQIKGFLSIHQVLTIPDLIQPLILQIDTCSTPVEVVFLQKYVSTGLLHPLGFYSAKLMKHRRNYSTTGKETLALILSLQHFESCLQDWQQPTLSTNWPQPTTVPHKDEK